MLEFKYIGTIILVLSFLIISVVWFSRTKKENNLTIFSFFGAPGSGKGTLAEQCIQKLNYKSLSTGNLCRENIAKQTELGKQLESYTKQGKLVPDEIISNMVKNWLEKHKNSQTPIILDGFPRTKVQAEQLVKILKEVIPGAKFRIIRLELPEEEIIERLAGRLVCENKKCQAVYNISMPEGKKGICSKCGGKLIKRADDREDVIRDRFKVYKKHEKELLDFYESAGYKIEELNISKLSKEEVFEKFKEII